jgi:hypothetical protein
MSSGPRPMLAAIFIVAAGALVALPMLPAHAEITPQRVEAESLLPAVEATAPAAAAGQLRRDPRAATGIHLRPADTLTHRLRSADPQLGRHRRNRGVLVLIVGRISATIRTARSRSSGGYEDFRGMTHPLNRVSTNVPGWFRSPRRMVKGRFGLSGAGWCCTGCRWGV